MRAIVIHCTCPDAAVADRIATALVEARLAACVQQVPGVRSTYRWAGRVEQGDEVLLLIKTAEDRFRRAEQLFADAPTITLGLARALGRRLGRLSLALLAGRGA